MKQMYQKKINEAARIAGRAVKVVVEQVVFFTDDLEFNSLVKDATYFALGRGKDETIDDKEWYEMEERMKNTIVRRITEPRED